MPYLRVKTFRAANVRALSTLPEQDGFAFRGVLHDGTDTPCVQQCNLTTGRCHVKGGATFRQLIGWRPL